MPTAEMLGLTFQLRAASRVLPFCKADRFNLGVMNPESAAAYIASKVKTSIFRGKNSRLSRT